LPHREAATVLLRETKMPNPFRAVWLITWLLIAAGLFAWSFRPSANTPVTINATPVASTTPASRPIETLRVGQRVATYSVDEASTDTRVDPATWRLLRLSATTTWEDGSPSRGQPS
jgi:hypothetical protein